MESVQSGSLSVDRSRLKSSADDPLRGVSRLPTTIRATGASKSVAVACVACRSRHLKCDGGAQCSRCRAEGVLCSYVKSRRGWKGPRRNNRATFPGNGNQTSHDDPLLPIPDDGISLPTEERRDSISRNFDATVRLLSPGIGSPRGILFGTFSPPNTMSMTATLPYQDLQKDASANPKAAFFAFFSACHPILPSAEITESLINDEGLHHLDLSIQYIGSSYVPSISTTDLRDKLIDVLLHQNPPKDGFTVQALLLFAIGLHANHEEESSAQALASAISIALDIGMNHADFAPRFSDGSQILEQSWVRTWWELYVMNALFAGVNKKVVFQLRSVSSDVPLPCEEVEFYSATIPSPLTLTDFDDVEFSQEELQFSSYTYLIDAVRILGKILSIDIMDPLQSKSIDGADACLVNWKLHLPQNKQEVISHQGSVDEVLQRAHMVISAASIMLHRPRSTLGSKEVQEITTCAPSGQHLLPTQTLEFHTVKSMQAAEEIAKLITLPSPLSRRTPFFTCAIVMAAVVHLSYWSFIVPDGEDGAIKQLIKLDTGALKSLAEVWPIARSCLDQVRGVAKEMFSSKKAMSLHFWNDIAGDDILQRIIEDASLDDLASQAS